MDRRTRINNPLVQLQAMLSSWQAGMFTALPGIYEAAGKGNTANVKAAIKGKALNQSGAWEDREMPLLINCPIVWPGGGGFQLTFPISKGDEGLIVFSQRCIDSWWQSGGVQSQAELRMHDISDGFFIPAMLSQAKAPSVAPSTSTVQLRSADGVTYIEVASGNVVNVHSAGGCNITGPVNITGAATITGALTLGGTISGPGGAAITGNLQMAGTVQGGAVVLNTHIHGGVQNGAGVTAGPT